LIRSLPVAAATGVSLYTGRRDQYIRNDYSFPPA
jgi:hypothetical protein